MSNWVYTEPDGEAAEWGIRVVMSEQMILNEVFEYYKTTMKRLGKEDQISEAECIEDWVIVNWASKTDEPVGITRFNVNERTVRTRFCPHCGSERLRKLQEEDGTHYHECKDCQEAWEHHGESRQFCG